MRGVATRADKRRRGLAMLLLNHVEFHLFERNADYLWANARVEALPFYEDACFDIVSQEFDIPGIGPHRLVVIRYDEDDDDFLDE